jgi:hypothetical protein
VDEFFHLNCSMNEWEAEATAFEYFSGSAMNELSLVLLEQISAGVSLQDANRLLEGDQWLMVLSSTMWELRTSLIYAEGHHDHWDDQPRPGPAYDQAVCRPVERTLETAVSRS